MSDILDSICNEVLDEMDVKTLGLEKFPRGKRVKLHSLKRGANLNSKQGLVVGPAKDGDGRMNGRLVVKLDAGRTLSVKPINLCVVNVSAADMEVRKAMREFQSTLNESMLEDVLHESMQTVQSEMMNPAHLQLFMDQMQQLSDPAVIQQLAQHLPQNMSMLQQALQNNPMFQQFSNSNPQVSKFLNQMMNISKATWQCPKITEQLPKLMESGLEQLQQMQNDPDAAREMMKKNMEEFREYCKRRDPEHFSPNTAIRVVKIMSPFVCENLKWHQGEGIFSLVIEFLVDPKKRDSQEQPF